MLAQWRRRVLWSDGILFGAIVAAGLLWTLSTGAWSGLSFTHPFWSQLLSDPVWSWIALGMAIVAAAYAHLTIRKLAARSVIARLRRETSAMREQDLLDNFSRAFRKNTSLWHSIFHKRPVGWGRRAQQRLQEVLIEANRYVQDLNDKFTNPSGKGTPSTPPAVAVEKPEKVSV